MSGAPSDPLGGFMVDETPAAAPAQPVDWDVIDWDALSEEEACALVDRLCEAPVEPTIEAVPPPPPPAPPTAHDLAVASFIDRIPPVSTSGRMIVEFGDPLVQVVTWAREQAGREVGAQATWVRFIRTDLQRGVLLIASTPDAYGSAELLVIAMKGMLTRILLTDAARWVFFALGLTRVTVHIPAGNAPLADLARRAGFAHEGVSRGYFRGRGDASRWSMTAQECRWLPSRAARPKPRSDDADPFPSGPFPSLKAH